MATALVLLIACINVAGLLLARGVTRRRGLAVCAALGASRGRLVRQLLTESVMLGAGGGVLGLAAAALVLRAVPALVPGDIARLDQVGIDGLTVAFTVGVSIAAGLLFGARAGLPVVADRPGEHPERGERAGPRRLPAAALQSDARGPRRGPRSPSPSCCSSGRGCSCAASSGS